jgi:hypothetical protein
MYESVGRYYTMECEEIAQSFEWIYSSKQCSSFLLHRLISVPLTYSFFERDGY